MKRLEPAAPGNTGISLFGVFGVEAWARGGCSLLCEIELFEGEESSPAYRSAKAVGAF